MSQARRSRPQARSHPPGRDGDLRLARIALPASYAPVQVIGFNDYFGWFDAGGGATDDRDALSPFLDSLRACYPNKALFITEFGFDANMDGPVEQRGTYAFQSDSAAFHLGVFATKPYLSGAIYFLLQDAATFPSYAGGNPFPDPPWDQKGLIDRPGPRSQRSRWSPRSSKRRSRSHRHLRPLSRGSRDAETVKRHLVIARTFR